MVQIVTRCDSHHSSHHITHTPSGIADGDALIAHRHLSANYQRVAAHNFHIVPSRNLPVKADCLDRSISLIPASKGRGWFSLGGSHCSRSLSLQALKLSEKAII